MRTPEDLILALLLGAINLWRYTFKAVSIINLINVIFLPPPGPWAGGERRAEGAYPLAPRHRQGQRKVHEEGYQSRLTYVIRCHLNELCLYPENVLIH